MAPLNDLQGGYPVASPVGYAGMEAEGQMVRDVASRVITTGAVAFGLAVGRGAGVDTARLGGVGFEGIAVADKTRPADQYAVGEVAGVLRKGTIWVLAANTVAVGDPGTFTAATGVIGAGLVSSIPNSKFETAGTVGQLVKLYIG